MELGRRETKRQLGESRRKKKGPGEGEHWRAMAMEKGRGNGRAVGKEDDIKKRNKQGERMKGSRRERLLRSSSIGHRAPTTQHRQNPQGTK